MLGSETPEDVARRLRGGDAVRVIDKPADAPPLVKITLAAVLTGVKVGFSSGPDRSDPMGQKVRERFYPTLDKALERLGHDTLNWIADSANNNGVGETPR